jgi:hypothetical protein
MERLEQVEHLQRPEPNVDNILKALSDYKMILVNNNTLLTQAPDELQDLRTILRLHSKIIKDYITRRALPPMLESDDVNLYKFIQTLKPMLTPWDADVSVLAKYWCEKLFETDFSFSTVEHMARILNKSKEDSIMPAGKEEK